MLTDLLNHPYIGTLGVVWAITAYTINKFKIYLILDAPPIVGKGLYHFQAIITYTVLLAALDATL